MWTFVQQRKIRRSPCADQELREHPGTPGAGRPQVRQRLAQAHIESSAAARVTAAHRCCARTSGPELAEKIMGSETDQRP
jgi:hypothetical protein